MKNRRRCFIDFDGTIVSNKYRLYQFFIDNINDEFKKVITIDEFWNLKKLGVDEIEWINLKYNSNIDKSYWINEKINKIENMYYLKYNKIFNYSKEALKNLNKYYNLILVTRRSNAANFYEELDSYNIKEIFNDILIVSHGQTTKSDIIKSKYNVNNYDIIIGDTEDDMKAAMELGITGLFVKSGIRSEWIINRYFRNYDRIICVNNISEILTIESKLFKE